MKKFITILVVAMVATTSNIYAQYASDALRFSQTNYGSTARFKGMGNAQIGVGGDMSSMSGNPAGLGLFTKSEFSLTPEFNQGGINANYLGKNTNTTKGQLNINQIGAVFYTPMYKQKGQDTKKGLISAVFGLGYSRNNDYHTDINYAGANNKTSIADYFAELVVILYQIA
jgi:stalled ribosome alternative rescue factor ArfA